MRYSGRGMTKSGARGVTLSPYTASANAARHVTQSLPSQPAPMGAVTASPSLRGGADLAAEAATTATKSIVCVVGVWQANGGGVIFASCH
jgi:hypothetical protein